MRGVKESISRKCPLVLNEGLKLIKRPEGFFRIAVLLSFLLAYSFFFFFFW